MNNNDPLASLFSKLLSNKLILYPVFLGVLLTIFWKFCSETVLPIHGQLEKTGIFSQSEEPHIKCFTGGFEEMFKENEMTKFVEYSAAVVVETHYFLNTIVPIKKAISLDEYSITEISRLRDSYYDYWLKLKNVTKCSSINLESSNKEIEQAELYYNLYDLVYKIKSKNQTTKRNKDVDSLLKRIGLTYDEIKRLNLTKNSFNDEFLKKKIKQYANCKTSELTISEKDYIFHDFLNKFTDKAVTYIGEKYRDFLNKNIQGMESEYFWSIIDQ